MMTPNSGACTVGSKILQIETGKLAMKADSAVTVRYGDTVVLVTTCISDKPQESASDFVRLTVDYEERHYSIGKIPGSFIRRESRPSEQATLSARLTDRSLRPLFSRSFPYDIQVVITILSTDQENATDVLAIIGASTALSLSSAPFEGPVAAVHIGYINDQLVVNPSLKELSEGMIDVVVASTRDAVVMVEVDAKEAPESLITEAILLGHQANQDIIKLQEDMQKAYGKPKYEGAVHEPNQELKQAIETQFGERLTQAITQGAKRADRDPEIKATKQEAINAFKEKFSEEEIDALLELYLKKAARKYILSNRIHLDGRKTTEIRPLSSEVGLLPRTHGSGLFTRGRTQILAITTLGSPRDEQMIDGLGLEDKKRFMLHYNFPPYSTGEVKRMGSPGRREIGHGALAERALLPVIPKEDEFSYTIRIVCEALTSDGSTSMASVCSSTLSLMDAGVPIKTPVVGIAMGLVTGGEDGNYVILTDIEGTEDFYGDMDFKVAGTKKGITAIQLDIKLHGVSPKILSEAMKQALEAHTVLFDHLHNTLSDVRPELSPYAPRMYRLSIDQSKIGTVIGPGGKTIRSITEQTGATIDIENDGTVVIGSPDEESAQKAISMVESLTREVEAGQLYTGKVTRIVNFGAFVEILPGKEGLVHISELADYRVANVEDIVKVGDEITVKVIEIDNLGRINLSRRAAFETSSTKSDKRDRPPAQERPERPPQRQHRDEQGFNHGSKDGQNRFPPRRR